MSSTVRRILTLCGRDVLLRSFRLFFRLQERMNWR